MYMQTIDINGVWELSPRDALAIAPYCSYFQSHPTIPCTLPGDIHSALLGQQLIPDPYIGTQELDIQWVGQHDWVLSKTFDVSASLLENSLPVLTLTMADTIIAVTLNGEEVGFCDNQFRRWRFDLSKHLREGGNTIELRFRSAEQAAMEKARELPYPIPYSVYPVSAKHRNLVRKTQCHSGWDWGPCILSFGIYEPIELAFVDEGLIESVNCDTTARADDDWLVTVSLIYNARQAADLPCKAVIADAVQEGFVSTHVGLNKLTFHLCCHNVQRWWPNGEGKAVLYPLELQIGMQTYTKRLGFRTLEVRTEEDVQGGKGMTFCVNGRDIFAKGANWIPMDALFSRIRHERYDQLLQSCVDANMNMLRVWGGGLYEMEDFYDLCDEKGILIWQDCMFSCSMYPATQEFLGSVEAELRYQVPRLMDHPSLALWCGNNEDLGAIGWYEESKVHPYRYVVDYDRLNEGVVGKVIKELDPKRTWWPSSPSSGPGDFSDNWHSDKRGDMHFWSVWHEGKPFEHYYSIKPRFVSEFGYQSFPSLSTVATYAPEDMWNLTSPVMEHHQKNDRGNSIIIENFSRYYRFPNNFEQMLYLSQVQQATAMKMAIEYYRTLLPHCMGTLYWQLNDNWPVASWSSIDYTGKWKLLHYAAKHFYNPALPIAYQKEPGKVEVYVVNDAPRPIEDMKLSVKFCTFSAQKLGKQEYRFTLEAKTSNHICTIDLRKKPKLDPKRTFIYLKLKSDDVYIENTLLLAKPKECSLEDPCLNTVVAEVNGGFSITVSCTNPAFQVALDAGSIKGVFSDNLFDIRPTAQKVVFFKTKNVCTIKQFKDSLKVFDLYGSSR
jgi:beta-mannosidase